MARTDQRQVIIITGPVGAGKSTTSLALARALRGPDCAVAVIDLDQMYGFVRQQDGYGEPTAWARARHGAAVVANVWFATGMSVVIMDGEFFTRDERDAVIAPLDARIECWFFTLNLSYEQALTRVQGDPSRGASKDPVFLKALHAHFAGALPFLQAESVVIDTDQLAQDEVVGRLIAVLRDQQRGLPTDNPPIPS